MSEAFVASTKLETSQPFHDDEHRHMTALEASDGYMTKVESTLTQLGYFEKGSSLTILVLTISIHSCRNTIRLASLKLALARLNVFNDAGLDSAGTSVLASSACIRK